MDCGKRTSKYTDQTPNRQPKLLAKAPRKPAKGPAGQIGGDEDLGDDGESQVYPSLSYTWVPEKPLTQTLFEKIREAGPEGISSPRISTLTVGFAYRRFLFPYLHHLSSRQPEHLRHFQLTREMVRKGKTSAYMFKVDRNGGGDEGLAAIQQPPQGTAESQPLEDETTPAAPISRDPFGFPALPESLAEQGEETTLSYVSQIARKTQTQTRQYRRAREIERLRAVPNEDRPATSSGISRADDVQGAPASQPTEQQGRSLRRFEKAVTAQSQQSSRPGVSTTVNLEIELGDPIPDSPAPESSQSAAAAISSPHDIQPYATIQSSYNDIAGNLVVTADKKTVRFDYDVGRKPMIIPVSSIINGPDIRAAPGGIGEAIFLEAKGEGGDASVSPYIFPIQDGGEQRLNAVSLQTCLASVRSLLDGAKAPTGDRLATPSARGRKRKTPSGVNVKVYVCDLCGGSWKNDVGLKYHRTKSKSSCNPDYRLVLEANLPNKRRKTERHAIPTPPATHRSNKAASRPVQGIIDRKTVHSTSNESNRQPIPLDNHPIAPHSDNFKIAIAARQTTARAEENQEHRTGGRDGPTPEVLPTLLELSSRALAEIADSPVRHPGLSSTQATQENTAALKGEHAAQDIQAVPNWNSDGEFRMPVESEISLMGAGTPKSQRIIEIVRYLLRCTAGVFPSGQGLVCAVQGVYAKAFPYEDEPQWRGCVLAVRAMEREKEVSEHTFAFRDGAGTFKDYRLLIRSDLRSSSPIVVAMKKKIHESHPSLYIPPAFAPPQDDLEALEVNEPEPNPVTKKRERKERRQLGDEVEHLEGPIYDALRKAPRGRIAHSPSLSPLRTRKRRATDEWWNLTVAKMAKRGPEDAESDGALDRIIGMAPTAIGAVEDNLGLAPMSPSASQSQALELEDDSTDDTDDDDGVGTEPPSPEVSKSIAQDFQELLAREQNPEYPFVSRIVLEGPRDSQGSWLVPPQRFFVKNREASFTMRGWMPATAAMIRLNLPQSVEDIRELSRTGFARGKWADPHWGVFCTDVEACLAWEISENGSRFLSTMATAAPEYVFFNFYPSPENCQSSMPVDLEWLEDNLFTLDFPPGDYLSGYDAEDEELPQTMASHHKSRKLSDHPRRGGRGGRGGRGRRRGLYPRDARASGRSLRGEPEKLPILAKQRDLTTHPRDPQDTFKHSEVSEKAIDWRAEDTRIAAFVAVRVLVGGVDKKVDWGILMRLFPDVSLSALRRFWPTVAKQRKSYIDKLTYKFQRDFLAAYEKGDLPPLNYDDVLAYDWRRLIAWTVRLVLHDAPDLPATRKSLDKKFLFREDPYPAPDWRDSYFQTNRSAWNRFQDSCSQAASVPLKQAFRTKDDAAMARSWIRALSCTAVEKYSPAIIRQKMLRLGDRTPEELEQLLDGVIKELQRQRVLKRSKASALRSGRPYTASEAYLTNVAKFSQVEKFTQAGESMVQLDACFRSGGTWDIKYMSNDGTIMALLNLQAHGRVKFEAVDVPNVPFGFEPGNYESRKFPKQYQHFPQRAVPTDRYIYSEDVAILESVRMTSPPGESPDGELPIWCDFFGEVDGKRWTRMLGSVLFLIATRGSLVGQYVSEAVKLMLDPFEVDMIVEWATRTGILTEAIPGGGLAVSEWWWLIVARLYEQEDIGPEVCM